MALRTVGTFAQTTLLGQIYNAVTLDSDLSLLNQSIKSDGNPGDGVLNNYITKQGHLYVPRRGWLTVLPGDMVVVDSSATGWPILLSAAAAGGAGWVHS